MNDINCGFKIFKAPVARELFKMQVMDDWSFDAEVIFLCAKYGYSIKEFPVKWIHMPTSKVRPLYDGVKSFMSLVSIRGNEVKGEYKRS